MAHAVFILLCAICSFSQIPAQTDQADDDKYAFVVPIRERQDRPPDNASLYVLAQYWRRQSAADPNLKLTQHLRERLLEACEMYPERAGGLVEFVPQNADTFRRLHALLPKVPSKFESVPQRELVQQFLSRHTSLFRDALVARAREAYEGEGFIEREKDLRALAKLDWTVAQPILEQLGQPSRPRSSALLRALRYEHALAKHNQPEVTALRAELREVAADAAKPARARKIAIDALMANQPWPGRIPWFLSLLKDSTLAAPSDGSWGLSPLETPAHQQPEFWLPRIIPLVKSANPSVRQNAIYILVSFQQYGSDARAAKALLPWLFDPKWVAVRDSGHSRGQLIYSLTKVHVPEAVPGLLFVLNHPAQADMFEIRDASMALEQWHDARAIPTFREVLASDKISSEDRIESARGLLLSGALSVNDKVAAVKALAEYMSAGNQLSVTADADEAEATTPGAVLQGLAVLQLEGERPTLLSAFRQKQKALLLKEPETAAVLGRILEKLPDPRRDAKLLAAISGPHPTDNDLHAVLNRRLWLRLTNATQLRMLLHKTGWPCAIASVVLNDSERQEAILKGADSATQIALLTTLKFSHDMVPDPLVEKLAQSPNADLSAAANAYWQVLNEMRRSF